MDSLQRLMRLMRRYRGADRGRASHSEAKLMHILLANGDLSAKELAERMDIRPPSLTEALERLEKRGEIERTRDDKDSRVYRINLTEHGRNELEIRSGDYEASRKEIESCLTDDEKRIFCEICSKLSDQLVSLSGQNVKGGM